MWLFSRWPLAELEVRACSVRLLFSPYVLLNYRQLVDLLVPKRFLQADHN